MLRKDRNLVEMLADVDWMQKDFPLEVVLRGINKVYEVLIFIVKIFI